MEYKFLLHNPQTAQLDEWGIIEQLNEKHIATIADDVVGSSNTKVGTSIPTPMARLFTFNTAFKVVLNQLQDARSIKEDMERNNKNKEIESSVYGGIVSDCLDLLEWMYKEPDRFRITDDIAINETFSTGKSKYLTALSEALKQTATSAYFGKGVHIKLIYYQFDDGRPEKLIGGTSPMTLVYLSPNWRVFAQDPKNLGKIQGLTNHVLFDNNFSLLHNRDPRFIAYLDKVVNSSEDVFPNHADYPLHSFKMYIKDVVDNLPGLGIAPYLTSIVKDVDNIPVRVNEAITVNLKKGAELQAVQSDFYLNIANDETEKLFGSKVPLVLSRNCDMPGAYIRKNDKGYNEFLHILKDSDYREDTRSFKNRILPGTSEPYPYIRDEDLFYNKLINVGYSIDDSRFITFGIESQNRYLLPIKPVVIKLLGLNSAREIKQFSKRIRLKTYPNKLTTEIDIPIRGSLGERTVTFKKDYMLNDPGIIKTCFDIAILPFFRMSEPELNNFPKYAVRYDKVGDENYKNVTSLKLLRGDGSEFEVEGWQRSKYQVTETSSYSSNYYNTRDDFRAILIDIEGSESLLIPKFPLRSIEGTLGYRFALDFGTTNTHIEYVRTDHEIRKDSIHVFDFRVNEGAPFMSLLNRGFNASNPLYKKDSLGDLEKVYEVVKREMITPYIGDDRMGESHSFPTRTVVLNFADILRADAKPFNDTSIAFMVGEDLFKADPKYTENLKWKLELEGNNPNTRMMIQNFFEQLFLMIQYKCLYEGCREEKIELYLSEPISLGPIKEALEKLILNSKTGMLPKAKHKFGLSESLAPFYFYEDATKAEFYTNIDVGGGTCDLFLQYMDNDGRPKKVQSSLRFAGNDLWGGNRNSKLHNGFINYYIYWVERHRLIFKDKSDELFLEKYQNFKTLLSKGSNENAINYLFKNDKVLKFSENVFNVKDFKLVLLLHYSAIIYYLACIIGKKSNEIKRISDSIILSFSGNASLYLKLLFANDDEKNISTKILSIILNNLNSNNEAIAPAVKESAIKKVIQAENPKEITAKGVLLQSSHQEQQIDNTRGGEDNTVNEPGPLIFTESDPVDSVRDISMDENYLLETINREDLSEVKRAIIQSNLKFHNELLRQFQPAPSGDKSYFTNKFGDLKIYKSCFSEGNLKEYVNSWVNLRNNSIQLKEEKALFFKVINQTLFDLSNAIFENHKITG